jgi:hypothetical protein
MTSRRPSRNTDVFIGGLISDVRHLEEKVKDLEAKTAQVNSLIFWNKIYAWLLMAIGSFLCGVAIWIISIPWYYPELWTRLVALLK